MTNLICESCEREGFSNKKALSNHKRWHNPKMKYCRPRKIIGINDICNLCKIYKGHGKDMPKDYCHACYKKILYYQKREKGIKLSHPVKPRTYQQQKEYLSKHPETVIKNNVRALTKYRHGRATICTICGSTERVQHHHLVPYNANNFINVCHKCHMRTFHHHLKEEPEYVKQHRKSLDKEIGRTKE